MGEHEGERTLDLPSVKLIGRGRIGTAVGGKVLIMKHLYKLRVSQLRSPSGYYTVGFLSQLRWERNTATARGGQKEAE